jgi:hypothetical protein
VAGDPGITELTKLREHGISSASPDDFPLVAELLESWLLFDADKPFPDEVAKAIRAALKTHESHPYHLIALEIFSLHENTVSLTPIEARNHSVKRVRGSASKLNKDRFRKKEQVGALRLVLDKLRALGDSPLENSHEPIARVDGLMVPEALVKGLVDAKVTRFYPSRRYYRLLRDGRGSISEYVSLSKRSVEMVSINLATGNEFEGLLDTFEELIDRPRAPVSICISLLDPEKDYLMKAIAPVIGASPETLAGRIADVLRGLQDFAESRLARSRRKYLQVSCHNVLPNASAIILDGDADDGLVQLETKGYKTGMDRSFGFEVAAQSEFFKTLRDSYRHLIADGRRVV